jgi:hypothetical protein
MELADNRREADGSSTVRMEESVVVHARASILVVAAGGLAFGAVIATIATVARRVAVRPALVVGAVAAAGYTVGMLLLQWAAGLSG